jgi:hypothetical protein
MTSCGVLSCPCLACLAACTSEGPVVAVTSCMTLPASHRQQGSAAVAPAQEPCDADDAPATAAAAHRVDESLQSAFDELATLKSQLSGVEMAVTLIKASSSSSGSSPAGGRSSPPAHGRRAPLGPQQQQAMACSVASSSSSSSSIRAGSPSGRHAALHLATQQLPVTTAGNVAGLSPKHSSAAGLPSCGAMISPRVLASGKGRPGQLASSQPGGITMSEADMLAVIKVRRPQHTLARLEASCSRRHGK